MKIVFLCFLVYCFFGPKQLVAWKSWSGSATSLAVGAFVSWLMRLEPHMDPAKTCPEST